MQFDMNFVVVELADGTFNAYARPPWRALDTPMCRKGRTREEAVKYLRESMLQECEHNGILSVQELSCRPPCTTAQRNRDRLFGPQRVDDPTLDPTPIGGQEPWAIRMARESSLEASLAKALGALHEIREELKQEGSGGSVLTAINSILTGVGL